MNEAQQHWEERYGERERFWSGEVNVTLAQLVADLPPGRVLDLGCGEGGDAAWFAERDWDVVAVDISSTALGRAAEAARSRGVADRIEFVQQDPTDDIPGGTYDLVSAQFLHSLIPFDRPRVLRAAAAALRPGGTLVIVDHGAAPPWAGEDIHHHEFPSGEEVVSGLALGPSEFDRVRVDTVEREGTGPDGQVGTLTDNVIVLRRRRGL